MNKRTRNMIIIAIVILLIGYLIMQRTKIKKITDPNEQDWDGTPVDCCFCDNSGSPVCSQFNKPSCADVGAGHVDAKNWASLDCGTRG